MNSSNVRRVSWWRLGLGLLLLLAGLKNLDQRNLSPELMPSNETQWFGYYLVTAVFLVAGVLLIVAGARRVMPRPPDER
jgi:hypothetical protein